MSALQAKEIAKSERFMFFLYKTNMQLVSLVYILIFGEAQSILQVTHDLILKDRVKIMSGKLVW